jgi:Na+/H+-dicarboxylate symporter
MVDLVMQAAPFFVFALLAGVVSKMAGNDVGKVVEIFKGLSWYSVTVLFGLMLMIFVVYPLILRLFVNKIPYFGFFKAMGPAQTLAFSTSSSAATLPVTMECVEQNLGVDKKVSSFVLPIGATVNMDGTSLYQAVAVVFMAQLHMIDLTFSQQLTIIFTTTLASIGSAAVPSAGLVMLIVVLNSVGLNPAWIAIIFPVDRILDMFRTVVNVTGDCIVAAIIADGEGMLHYGDVKNQSETFDLDS